MNNWRRFDGAQFRYMDAPPETEEIDDWSQGLKSAGWDITTSVTPNEFSTFSFDSYRRLGIADQSRLVCINDEFGGISNVICDDEIAYLKFLKEFVAPIVQISVGVQFCEMLTEINETLFDEEDGLDIVREVRLRQRRSFAKARAERKAKEAASATPTRTS